MGAKRNQPDIDRQIKALRAQSPPATYKEIALKLRVSERHIADVLKRGKAPLPREEEAEAPPTPPPRAPKESEETPAAEVSDHEGKHFQLDEPDPPRGKPTSEPQEAAEKREAEVKRVEFRFW